MDSIEKLTTKKQKIGTELQASLTAEAAEAAKSIEKLTKESTKEQIYGELQTTQTVTDRPGSAWPFPPSIASLEEQNRKLMAENRRLDEAFASKMQQAMKIMMMLETVEKKTKEQK